MRRTLIAVAAILLTAFTLTGFFDGALDGLTDDAAAAAKPNRPPKAAKPHKPKHHHPRPHAQPVVLTVTDTTFTLTATGLTAGTTYGYVIEVWGCGNPSAYWRGGSATVRLDGTVTVTEDISYLREWALPGELYEVVVWLYDTDYWTAASNPDGVPLEREHEFAECEEEES